jgi:hypothetical protein
MSLAMFAAPFDDNTELNSNNSDNLINQKRRTHSKTYKKYPKENFDTNKVNSVLEKIHSNLDKDDDDDDKEGFNFNPPPPAKSAGVERTKPLQQKEQMMNMSSNNDLMFRTLGRAPQPNYEGGDDLDLNDYSIYGDNKTNEEYYKRVIPGYTPQKNPVNKPYYSTANSQPVVQEFASQDVLLQKLNYMITLLEDQQDERTNNVTEEVVLYSFLGIFIIFIADTFVKAGKYTR